MGTERFPLKDVQNKTFVALLPLFGGEGNLKIYNILNPVQVKDLHAVLQFKSIRTHS